MTDREKAIVMAHTGIAMLNGEKFQIFHEYIEKILGRPVWTHELGDELVWNEIKKKSKDDFIEICKTEERPQGEFTIDELIKWLNEIVFYNSKNDLGQACLEIIGRLDGFEKFVADMRKEAQND